MSTPTDLPQETTQQPQGGSLLGDRIIAVIVTALGAVLLFLAFGFPEPGQPEDPGTAALPRLIGGALVILGIMLLFNSERNTFLPEEGTRLRTVLIVVVGVVYALLMTPLGFMLSTLAFMVLGLLIMGVRSIVRLILVPVLVSVAVYYLFTAALGVYLPSGVIEGILP
ncbi:tripartite tricarboxylate transporter TctB family protein [Corynebacterium kalidii]|uniref:Tripartite tricarboxylate transporter TctB family protein n=1 Tax=Corynebacterium kalidii TaxID=2931982 RepID=A0A9X2B1M2_9CORY|nr:tripartite tricarboxylate transporter TctB family protein [Corynebacterium kalidii]MCJ7858194.1 tripartite tricarboxylate transporter TctB family protein [Corynebacterium kalidii]